MSEQRPTEAQEIIAALERLGLNALATVQAMRKEIEETGKEPMRSAIFTARMYELDGYADCLAHALWIHTWHGKEVPRGTEGPANYQGIKHLHKLQGKVRKP